MIVLRNEVMELRRPGAQRPVVLVGLDDEWSGHIDPEKAWASIPDEMRPEKLLPSMKQKLLVPDLGKRGIAMFTDIVTVQPGEDVTFCTYTGVFTDKLTYIHDTAGSQTRHGHHAIMQYTTSPNERGTRKCEQESLEVVRAWLADHAP